MRGLVASFCLAVASSFVFAAPENPVVKAYADSKGQVHILTAENRNLMVAPEKGQEQVDNIQVAEGGKTVGSLIETSACSVSYPVPLGLVVWRSGRIIRRVHPSMAIWSWAFLKNGKESVYRNSPLHGGWSAEYVLVDIPTGKTLAFWDHPVNANGVDADDISGEPDWAKQIQ